jgi:anthranilate phosphoribosyltransferase
LKTRTVFNLLGPLTNPAGAKRQLIGAPSVEAAGLMAQALAGLEPERAFVVHGSDGLDEVTTTGPTAVFEVTREGVRRFEWSPSDFGVEQADASDLEGGDRTVNCEIATSILRCSRGAQRDIVMVNAAAALVVSGQAKDLLEGMEQAAESIDSGAAMDKIDELASFTAALEPETRS